MITFESCDCDCCRRAVVTLEKMDTSRAGDLGLAERANEQALQALDQRDRWRTIARQLFRQAIFSSPEARAKIVAACPGIEKENK